MATFPMDFNSGSLTTPTKKSKSKPKQSENFNPNVSSTPKSAQKNPTAKISSPSPRNKIRERKFVVAKKNPNKQKPISSKVTCKCNATEKSQKCLCVAYETLRASQEEFFTNPTEINTDGYEYETFDEIEECGEMGSENLKRRRDKLLEEARRSVPEIGSGVVKHLVKAFEKLLSIPKTKGCDENDEKDYSEDLKKGMKWALPGLQESQPRVCETETQVSSSSFCPSDYFLNSESLGLESSLDSCQGSISLSRRSSGGGRRSRRNSSESTGTFGGKCWKRRQLRVTSQNPFKLRTEQRGRSKEEEFIKKVQQMMTEEEKQRIPIAQGLPWTTDEPECLAKPPVKESTRPIDLVLHSDLRAVERAEFDHQVAEKMSLLEQYKMEREKQQKLEEEEEIRRLRKELVPRAQPMPYFDRPFIPRRSEKHPTIPREPRFHLPQHKKIKCCMYTQQPH